MSFTELCSIMFLFYFVIWFFDSFLKSCMHYPYLAFLEGTGLKVGIFHFTWTTTAFNRCIYRWSKNFSRILKKWFSCGYYITLWVFLPYTIWCVLMLLIQPFKDISQTNSVPEVKVIVPGFNIPVSDFWVYFVALFMCSIFHELGHAMAGAQEDLQLISIGVFIFTIIPVAFVTLNTEHLNTLAIKKRLKIYCAGIWHNIAMGIIALLLFLFTPIIFSIAYKTDLGVKVVDFTYNSPLNAKQGLEKGDLIISLNGCNIKNINDWHHCINMAHEKYGICTNEDFVADNDEVLKETMKENNIVECCSRDNPNGFCFEYMEIIGENLPDLTSPSQYACLKPREMIKEDFIKCSESEGYICPRNMYCLRPSISNKTYFMIIERLDDVPVLYLGLPYDLRKTVFVDPYFPRLAIFSLFSPMEFEKLLKYVFIFSMGIAFLNIIPCYGTDGHHIARNLIQVLAKYLDKDNEFVNFFTMITIVLGTFITVPMLIYSFYRAVAMGMF